MLRALFHRCAIALLSLGLLAPGGASAALLSLVPDTGVASDGQSVAVDLLVSDLGNAGAPSVGAFSADIFFDMAALSFENYALGGLLGNSAARESVDISSGLSGSTVGLGEVSFLLPATLDALQPDTFVLATLNFTVLSLAPGQTTVLAITPGALVSDTFGRGLDTATARGTITGSTPVPAPATLWLMLSALLVRCAIQRRQPL